MQKQQVKKTLTETYGFLDNDYLELYITLIENSKFQTRIKFKTQAHHFIPVEYYKNAHAIGNRRDATRCANSDKNNFKVNLLYKDHVLAHYYLSLCTCGKLKYQNECAIFHVLGNINYIKDSNYLEEIRELKDLEKYQELYEDAAHTRSELYMGRTFAPISDKQKAIISEKNIGATYVRKYMQDQWIVKKVFSETDLEKALKEGWEKGNRPRENCRTDVSKAISKAKKGKICINNGFTNKYIDGDDKVLLDHYLQEGWVRGGRKMGTRPTIYVHKLGATRKIFEDTLERWLRRGWSLDGNR